LKFGGPILLGALAIMLFELIRVAWNKNMAVVTVAILLSNPWIIRRYTICIREDYALVLLLMAILVVYNYTVVAGMGEKKYKAPIVLLFSLIAASVISTHLVIACVVILIIYVILKDMQLNRIYILVLSLVLASAAVWGYLITLLKIFSAISASGSLSGWYKNIEIGDISLLSILFSTCGFYFYYKYYRGCFLTKIFVVILVFSVSGVIVGTLLKIYPAWRFLVYFIIALSYFAALGLYGLNKNLQIKSYFKVILPAVIVVLSFISVTGVRVWEPFTSEDVRNAERVLVLCSENFTICSEGWDFSLLSYVYLKNIIDDNINIQCKLIDLNQVSAKVDCGLVFSTGKYV
jgi:hypothetical protein